MDLRLSIEASKFSKFPKSSENEFFSTYSINYLKESIDSLNSFAFTFFSKMLNSLKIYSNDRAISRYFFLSKNV